MSEAGRTGDGEAETAQYYASSACVLERRRGIEQLGSGADEDELVVGPHQHRGGNGHRADRISTVDSGEDLVFRQGVDLGLRVTQHLGEHLSGVLAD
jgi:hypothetical protein